MFPLVFWGGSRTATISKMVLSVIIVNGFQSLTIITTWSILDIAAVLDSPLGVSPCFLFLFSISLFFILGFTGFTVKCFVAWTYFLLNFLKKIFFLFFQQKVSILTITKGWSNMTIHVQMVPQSTPWFGISCGVPAKQAECYSKLGGQGMKQTHAIGDSIGKLFWK